MCGGNGLGAVGLGIQIVVPTAIIPVYRPNRRKETNLTGAIEIFNRSQFFWLSLSSEAHYPAFRL